MIQLIQFRVNNTRKSKKLIKMTIWWGLGRGRVGVITCVTLEIVPILCCKSFRIAFSTPLTEEQCLHNIVFKIHCLKFLASISLMHCSDFIFIISTICNGKMAVDASVEAAIEKCYAKIQDLGSPAISKMELLVTLYDCHKELHLRWCRGPSSTRGYKLSFCIDHCVNFPCLQKKLCHLFFTFCGSLSISDMFFFWKVDKKELLEVLRSFYISTHHFSQTFRTSFSIIWKNSFRYERWECDKDL